jgi:hypothetical protein
MSRTLRWVVASGAVIAASPSMAALLQFPKTFSVTDVPLTYGISAEAETFLGATIPRGSLVNTVLLEPVQGLFAPLLPNEALRGIKLAVDTTEPTRLGFQLGTRATGGLLSSEFAVRTDVQRPNQIHAGDRVTFSLDPVMFAGPDTLTVEGPELTAFMDLVTEGAFRFEAGFADGNGTIVNEPISGTPLRAQFDFSFTSGENRVFEVGGGTIVKKALFDGIDLKLRNPGSPDVASGQSNTSPIGGLLNPGGFRTTAQAVSEPFLSLDFDVDALVSKVMGVRSGVEGPGFSVNAGITGIDSTLGLDPYTLTSKIDLVNLGVEVGPAIRNDYRLDVTGIDFTVLDVANANGDPLNLDIQIGPSGPVGQVPLTFTVPADAQPGDTFTLEVDMRPFASIRTQTGIVGGLAQTFDILSISQELAGTEVYKKGLVNVEWPLRQTVPLNLASSTQDLSNAFRKQRLSIPFTIGEVIPEPTTGLLLVLSALTLAATPGAGRQGHAGGGDPPSGRRRGRS